VGDPRFLQKGFDKQLSHLIEECGEVLAAAGKTQRWGRKSTNPLLPIAERESNEAWLLRELQDLKLAIQRVENTINQTKEEQIEEMEK
jgi:NTP pyrophosphatase (non-canonical NTP hydrolase)